MDQSTVSTSANSKASKAIPDTVAFFWTDLAQINANKKIYLYRL
jgi:hypothetical protein